MTTGTTQNTGNSASIAFCAGVAFADLEFIQYHPTTVQICDKRMLISEAARGEGGRLFVMRGGKAWYFMEEKYPELGNLMPRDVVSREMVFVDRDPECSGDIFLDMTALDPSVWAGKLSDLRQEIISYMRVDPMNEPVSVSPGIHFFMGGIRVDDCHVTNVRGLLAAGEAACKYHGANRLGGNSMLGAVFGGKTAAETACKFAGAVDTEEVADPVTEISSPAQRKHLREALLRGLGILRTSEELGNALADVEDILSDNNLNSIDCRRAILGYAMLRSAIARKESRGAHYRLDYPDTDDEYKKMTGAVYEDGEVKIGFFSPSESWKNTGGSET